MKRSAGFVIIYDNGTDDYRILLAHPTNAAWMGTYSIPKGEIDKGETPFDAAKRETLEEVGVRIRNPFVKKKGDPFVLPYFDKSGNVSKKVYYYFVILNDLKKIRLSDFVIPKSRLQMEEVNWAGFITMEEAQQRINKRMRPILRQIARFKKMNWKI